MQAIKEMCDVIRKLMIRRSPAIKHILDANYYSTKLLDGIESSEYTTDQEAAEGIFPGVSPARKQSQLYRRVKYDLINRLILMFYFVKIRRKSFSSYLAGAFTAKKELVVAELLQWFQCHEAMRLVAQRVLSKAQQFHLTYEQLRCTEMLRNYHSLSGPREECQRLTEEVETLSELYHVETKASNINSRMRAEFTRSMTLTAQIQNEIAKECEWLEQQTIKHQTRTLWLYYSDTAAMLNLHLGCLQKGLQIYQLYLRFLLENSHLSTNERILHVCDQCLLLCIALRKYDQAAEFLHAGNEHADQSRYNWFHHQMRAMLLYLHTKDWSQAVAIYKWVINHPSFRNQPLRVEVWSVIEAYLRFFCGSENEIKPNQTVHGNEFTLHHLLQEIEEGRKDKTGMNVAIIVFQILHYLKERRFDLFELRVMAMQSYVNRHVKECAADRYDRVRALQDRLNAVVSSNYNITLMQSHKLLSESQAGPLPLFPGVVQIEEIVPYEHIWERVLIELKQIEQEGHFVKEYRGAYQSAP